MSADGAVHPLDPLTAAEISQVAAIVRRAHAAGPGWRFASIELDEPAKDLLTNDAAIERQAEIGRAHV